MMYDTLVRLDEQDATPSEKLVILALAEIGPTSAKAVATHTGLNRCTASSRLSELHERETVVRRPDVTDPRQYLYALAGDETSPVWERVEA